MEDHCRRARFRSITDANTTIDGTAYYNTTGVWGPAGVTVRDTNAGQVGTGGLVGVDGLTLDKVNRPELELTRGGAFAGDGIAVSAGAVTVKNLAVNSFNGSQIYVSSAVTAAAGQAIITGTLVGTRADGTDAGGTENYGIRTNGAATISNNYIGYVEGNAVMMSDAYPRRRLPERSSRSTSIDNEVAFTRVHRQHQRRCLGHSRRRGNSRQLHPRLHRGPRLPARPSARASRSGTRRRMR